MSEINYEEALKVPGIEVFRLQKEQAILFRTPDMAWITKVGIRTLNINEDSVASTRINNLKSLIYNHISFDNVSYAKSEELEEFIDQNTPRYTPGEKLENALRFVANLMSYDGQQIDLNVETELELTEIWRKYYYNNEVEFMFYIETLSNRGYLEYTPTSDTLVGLRLTVSGLAALVENNEAHNSRYCFIAMSFDKKLTHIYSEAILPALNQTGYLPFILTERHVDSERTVNDEIITGLKKARFTIAEFTQHRHGVYFEAGYALGRGQKVIYVCSKSDFNEAHFDTNHFQHIIWETTEDLKKQLIDKINAFIID